VVPFSPLPITSSAMMARMLSFFDWAWALTADSTMTTDGEQRRDDSFHGLPLHYVAEAVFFPFPFPWPNGLSLRSLSYAARARVADMNLCILIACMSIVCK
jgi:hypothetical protein